MTEILSSMLHARHVIHYAHWGINGDKFIELHKLFGEQYKALDDMADRYAEYLIAKGNIKYLPSTLMSILDNSIFDDGKIVDYSQSVLEIFQELYYLCNKDGIDKVEETIFAEYQEYFLKQIWILKQYTQ